ncbi:MAG: transglutaminase family protein [Acidobacteriota bacterium]
MCLLLAWSTGTLRAAHKHGSYEDRILEFVTENKSAAAAPNQRRHLDRWTFQARRSGKDLSEWFFQEARFRGTGQPGGVSLADDLDLVLTNRSGACLSLASVYLALGERLGVRVWPVATPRHVFIREEINGRLRNVELLEAGAHRPDVFYLNQEKAPAQSPEAARLLRELTPRQFIAYLKNNRAVAFREQGKLETAGKTYREALRLDPDCQPCHYNYGNFLAAMGQRRKALRQFDRALDLHPWDLEARRNRDLLDANRSRTRRRRHGSPEHPNGWPSFPRPPALVGSSIQSSMPCELLKTWRKSRDETHTDAWSRTSGTARWAERQGQARRTRSATPTRADPAGPPVPPRPWPGR